MGLLRCFRIVARNRLKINTRKDIYNLRDGTSFWAVTGGPHEGMLSDLLGDIDLVWSGGPFNFESLDEVDSRLGRLFYLSSADGGDVTVVRLVIGCGVGSLAVLHAFYACVH